jgi:hypothetical protein
MADEPVYPDVLSAVVPAAEGLSAFFRPIPYEELRAGGRAGLFTP